MNKPDVAAGGRKAGILLLVLLVFAFWIWQSPGDELQPEEIADYLNRMQAGLPMESTDKALFIERLRSWAEADDGEPVHMLNLIRFHQEFSGVPGFPEFKGTAEEANAHYEQVVMPMLVKRGGYPVFASSTQGLGEAPAGLTNLLGFQPELEGWDRVMLVRYPTRRAFLDLASDPAYMKVVPFKIAAIDLGFVPLDKQYMVPDLRWLVALLGLALIAWLSTTRKRNN